MVIQQPPMVSITGDDYYKACPDTKRAHKSMIAAIITSLVFALFGCWWALPLTIPAVALGVKVCDYNVCTDIDGLSTMQRVIIITGI